MFFSLFSYFFTARLSCFLGVFFHHSFTQINNIAVPLFCLIIVIRHESFSKEGIEEKKDSSFIIDG